MSVLALLVLFFSADALAAEPRYDPPCCTTDYFVCADYPQRAARAEPCQICNCRAGRRPACRPRPQTVEHAMVEAVTRLMRLPLCHLLRHNPPRGR